MITVALFWIASNQEESKSLLWKGWINDLYTHAMEHCTAVRLSKPQVQTTVDETQTWSWLGEAGHKCTHWKPGMSERNKTIQAQWLWCERQGTVPCWGLGASDGGEHEGSSGRLSFHFLIWMPAPWVFLSIHAVVHCWQVYNFVFPTWIKSWNII